MIFVRDVGNVNQIARRHIAKNGNTELSVFRLR